MVASCTNVYPAEGRLHGPSGPPIPHPLGCVAHRPDGGGTAQGSNLDGHKLQIFLSQLKRKEDGGGGSKAKAAATKLMVRNVAFEATRKDIRDVFQLFGLVKSVRLPSKFDKTHRWAVPPSPGTQPQAALYGPLLVLCGAYCRTLQESSGCTSVLVNLEEIFLFPLAFLQPQHLQMIDRRNCAVSSRAMVVVHVHDCR